MSGPPATGPTAWDRSLTVPGSTVGPDPRADPGTDPREPWSAALVARPVAGPVLLVGVASAYLVITQLVLWLNEPANGGAGLWPAAGMSLAVLLLVPPRRWGWVLAGVAAAELGGDLARGFGLAVSLGWTLGNCVEPLLGALLIRRFSRVPSALTPLPQMLRFLLLGVVVAPLVGASVGATATVLEFGAPMAQVWPAYVVGDALGVLVVAPALLALRARIGRRRVEAAALVVVSLLVAALTYLPRERWTEETGLLLVPCFTWAALRFGVRGTAWSAVAVTLVANTATALDRGPFALASTAAAGLTSLQAYLAVTVAGALVLAASVADLRDGRQVARALHHQATHDHLTGLPNRAYLASALDDALGRCAAGGGEVGVLLCDVDLLKVVNDTHGHAAGDRYLVDVARRLAAAVGPDEVVARVGGDEFLVLVAGGGTEDLDRLARRLQAEVQQPVDLTRTKRVVPSVSIGVATGDGGSSSDDVVTRADQALYRAKQAGRGRIEHHDARLRQELRERQVMQDALPQALRDGQVYCEYQPEVDLATGQLFGFETLARWRHPVHGLIPPDRFVPVVEATGHAADLFEAVLQRTLTSQTAWAAQLGFRPAVAVNVSALQLGDTGLVDQVGAALERAGAPADTLWLEVTETASADPGASDVLRALHDRGIHLAIDDFGTGWSSMSRLADHPWDMVKLDRSFIAPLGSDPRAEHLVRAVVAMAHALGMRTVAEGVETDEQLQRVSELGCDVAQGFLFSRAVGADAAVRLVDARGRWTGPGGLGPSGRTGGTGGELRTRA